MLKFLQLLMLLGLSLAGPLKAAEVNVAVAANFTAPMKAIAVAFEQDTGHKALLSFGSTGKFYAQIKKGAPFHVLLAADDETPARLEKEGAVVSGTRVTYAIGRLALWSKQPGRVDDKGEILRKGDFERLAIADPKLAPYGLAAMETLTQLGLMSGLQAKLVVGESIAQAYQFVATANAALGFVALSQVTSEGRLTEGSVWVVPAQLHTTIRQDAALLLTGKENPAALALFGYMRSERARAVIRSYGYEF